MITQEVLDKNAKEVGKIELADGVFGIKPKKHIIKDVVVMQMANRRSGNAETKTRSDVRGGGRKPFKQKGTGNARQGTTRSPLMPGGGIVFGPHKRDYSYLVPKKVRKAALKTALIIRKSENKLYIFEKLDFDTAKTRDAASMFKKLNINSALIIDGENKNLKLSVRNLPGFKFLKPEGINVYDILKHESLVMTRYSMEKVEEALLK